jgi:hypothetical protein
MQIYTKDILLQAGIDANEKLKKINCVFVDKYGEHICLIKELKRHYGRYTYKCWQEFLFSCFTSITNVVFQYKIQIGDALSKVSIVSIALLIEDDKNRNVYIRCICSNCHKGGFMMQYIIDKYRRKSYDYIHLNSEPDPYVLRFYRRYGFLMLNEVYINAYGIRYPKMVLPINKRYKVSDHLIVNTSWFFPGFMYYIIICYEKIKGLL